MHLQPPPNPNPDLTNSSSSPGLISAISIQAIPLILTSPPPHPLRQWRLIYDKGSRSAPPFALLAATSLAYASYAKAHSIVDSGQGASWQPLAAAAAATVAIVPYTILTMASTNNVLIADSDRLAKEGKGKLSEVEVKGLVWKWGKYNLFRALFPLGGAVLAAWTLL